MSSSLLLSRSHAPARSPGWRWPTSPFLVVNPRYEALLNDAGLSSPDDFLRLPEVIVSGHPDRQVSRVELGAERLPAVLKKEHRVPWKERLANWWAGFGLASKSWRECQTLQSLEALSPLVPEWIAAGQSSDGRSFLLLRAVGDGVELRRHLADHPLERRALARRLGETLGQLHARGFVHGDLYANHVLIVPATGAIRFLDWQRSPRPGRIREGNRWRDLATLSATLPEDLAGPPDRLACLRAYLGVSGTGTLDKAIMKILRLEKGLRLRRHIRTKAIHPTSPPNQSLTCVEPDNALMVTAAGLELWPDGRPDCLDCPSGDVVLPDGSLGRLLRGSYRKSWFAGRTWTSPERMRMSLLFRLQRYGVPAPEVLAVGERPSPDGRIDAFLLTRLPGRTLRLTEFLARCGSPPERRRLLDEAAAILAGLHRAGCFFRRGLEELAVVECANGPPRVALRGASGLVLRRRLRGWWRRRDLRRLALVQGGCP